MKIYRHLFFDLDGTLWDLYRNTRESLSELFNRPEHVPLVPTNKEEFYNRYLHHNDIAWRHYRQGIIERDELRTVRFRNAFGDIGLTPTDATILQFADDFSEVCPRQPFLVEGTMEMLTEFKDKIPMHIITNGFRELQFIKLNAGAITEYFMHIVNADDCDAKKPDPRIFQYALDLAGADAGDSLMIGDDWEADILGARDFGMDQAWLRREGERHNYRPTYTIDNMHDLATILRDKLPVP